MPYLPIDPADVGRSYKDVIRINSQSGKGGIAFILENNYGYQLPKAMHPEIGKIIQAITDTKGKVLESSEIFDVFKTNYLDNTGHIKLVDFTLTSVKGISKCILTYKLDGKEIVAKGEGNGPVDACKNALNEHYDKKFSINSYSEHSFGDKSSAKAIAYIEIQNEYTLSCFGVGADNDIATASIKALFCAINRAFS